MTGEHVEIDYPFVALCIAQVFGWTLAEVFALTSPQFLYIAQNLHRVQWQRGKNEVFFGISAAFAEQDARKTLLDGAKDWVTVLDGSQQEYTPEMLEKAQERARELINKRGQK